MVNALPRIQRNLVKPRIGIQFHHHIVLIKKAGFQQYRVQPAIVTKVNSVGVWICYHQVKNLFLPCGDTYFIIAIINGHLLIGAYIINPCGIPRAGVGFYRVGG